jgi:hypothetical protein
MSPSVVPVRRSGSIARRNASSRAAVTTSSVSLPILSSLPGLAAVDVLPDATDQGPARPAENVNESWLVLAILPPCGSRDLDVVAHDFKLILSPRTDLLHQEAVVADAMEAWYYPSIA